MRCYCMCGLWGSCGAVQLAQGGLQVLEQQVCCRYRQNTMQSMHGSSMGGPDVADGIELSSCRQAHVTSVGAAFKGNVAAHL